MKQFLPPRPTSLAVVLVAALQASPSNAQAPVDAQRAQAYVDLGTSLFVKKQFQDALTEFKRAEPLVADVATRAVLRFNIARCYEELGRPEEAAFAFARYLELPDEPDARARAQVKLLALYARHFGTLTIAGTPGPSATSGAGTTPKAGPPTSACHLRRTAPPPIDVTPTDCSREGRLVFAGAYVVDLRSTSGPSRQDSKAVEVKPGGTSNVSVVLPAALVFRAVGHEGALKIDGIVRGQAPLADVVVAPGSRQLSLWGTSGEVWHETVTFGAGEVLKRRLGPPTPVLVTPPEPDRTWAWASAGTGALALIGGAYFYSSARGHLDEADGAFDALSRATSRAEYDKNERSLREDDDAAGTDRVVSFTLLGTGLVLAGLATWFFLDPGEPAAVGEVRF